MPDQIYWWYYLHECYCIPKWYGNALPISLGYSDYIFKKKKKKGTEATCYVVNVLVCQHLFNTIGFAGSNAVDNLELFSIVDAAADAWVRVYDAIYHEKNEELKVWMINSNVNIMTLHCIISFAETKDKETSWKLPPWTHSQVWEEGSSKQQTGRLGLGREGKKVNCLYPIPELTNS